ncbi:tetratricopeptide repeat protein [Sphingomonas sp.]|uniref:tetratricopeptide repeat protein n=1 Tax=Sphingomonas sp. TaxID=28214 RepID=UPI003CC5277F
MGWLTLVLLGGVAFAALVVLGLARPLWSLAGAALMLGATGYALQGSPTLASRPARPELSAQAEDPGLIALRDEMLGHGSAQAGYVVAADAMTRVGDKQAAVQWVLGGISHFPDSPLLWTALGNTLAAHDGGRVSPPALFAFRQAIRLGREQPGPYFFLGLAYVRAGDFPAARPFWAKAVALSPAAASYRGRIAGRLALLDVYLAQAGR